MASAASLYEQYAARVREANPTLASFYENFISRATPEAAPCDLTRLSTGDDIPTNVTAIDRLLEASLKFLDQDNRPAFTQSMIIVVTLYARCLSLGASGMLSEMHAINLPKVLDAIDVAEKLVFCLGRLRDVAERQRNDDQ